MVKKVQMVKISSCPPTDKKMSQQNISSLNWGGTFPSTCSDFLEKPGDD